jgi:Ulp1 family protease
LVIPIDENNNWVLVIVLMPEALKIYKGNNHCILYFDSLNNVISVKDLGKNIRNFLKKRKLLEKKVKCTYKNSKCPIKKIKCVKQLNHIDCGVFVCCFFEKFLDNIIKQKEIKMTNFTDITAPDEMRKKIKNLLEKEIKK